MTQSADPISIEDQNTDRQFVNALARGLELLRCFQPGKAYLTNADLARETGFPKPTVSRLTYTLCKLGYLEFSEHLGKYQLASGVLGLGYSMLANLDVRNLARPAMQELAEHSRVSVAIGVRDRLSMIYVETCRSSARVTLRLDVGSRIPIATTSMGKALICGMADDERDGVMDEIRNADPENWSRLRKDLEKAFRDYDSTGFCIALGEWQPEIRAVGVPLLGMRGEKQMAFNCGGPAYLLARDKLETDLGPRLVELVRNVEKSMGGYASLPNSTKGTA
ncbi:IclR family transcriptional regulator [Pollutimonas harenae]|uniref:IclR family transcriptional regulator n=1 Tax=Pollutimonas harenae TaxID=657015 RepID=A0A853GSU9_9BURK|nr:IclR family transcriptional regulator [Pollutimonas harenae]NYT85237.1 IclR family transcriptional regulator [Pollutimonas harenae]TEA72393.1 IclR family transcriptional regulator [Pollutimonas harenae]